MQFRRSARLSILCVGIVLWGCGGGQSTIHNLPSTTPIAISPTTATIVAGQSAVYTISLQSAQPLANPVLLTVTGLPSQASAKLTPGQVTLGTPLATGTSTLTISTNSTIPLGTYTFTVGGTTSNTTFGTAQATLVVQNANTQPGFTLTVTPPSATVLQGVPAVFQVMVSPTGGFTGSVNLTVTGGGPNFVVSQPTPSQFTLNGQTSMNAAFSVALAPGATGSVQTTLTITATSSTSTQTATVTVLPQ